MKPETWKPIPSAAGYEASDHGRVRSWWVTGGKEGVAMAKQPRVMTPFINKYGRWCLHIKIRGRRALRAMGSLILETFRGPPRRMDAFGAPGIRFLDGDSSNLRLDNLEWIDEPRPKR